MSNNPDSKVCARVILCGVFFIAAVAAACSGRVRASLERLHLGALRVHVRVVQRVSRAVAVGRVQLRRRGEERSERRGGVCARARPVAVRVCGRRRRVHVRVRRVHVRVRVVLEGVRARVQAQVGQVGVAVVRVVTVTEVLQVHEPLGPEASADPLAVHGQVDELACDGRTGGQTDSK